MKTRMTFALLVLALVPSWMTSRAAAQGTATTGTVQVTPPKPAPAKAPAAAAGKATAKATTAKATTAKATKAEGTAAKVGPRSIIGEVVDPACWIVNGAKGPSHKECAIACAKAGQVLAIVENKTQKLYMVATDKPGEDPNKGLIDYVGQTVLVKGRVYSRGGATGIKVTSVEPYSPTAVPTE